MNMRQPKIHCRKEAHLLCLVLPLIFVALSFAACNSKPTSSAQEINSKKIALLQFGTHPVINAVVEGFKSRINQLYGDRVSLVVYNGNFDMATVGLLSKQMVASDADILVSVTTPASGQLLGANRGAKPLVFTFVSEPAALGYKGPGSLANATGLSDRVNYDKTLNLIRSYLPAAKRIGYLLTRSESNAVAIHKGFEAAAPKHGFTITTATVGQSTDIRTAAETLAPNVDVFLFGGDNTIASGFEALLHAATSRKLAVFACDEESVSRGAVAAVSVDYPKMGRTTADLCSALLGSADPNRIPVEAFTASKLVINKSAATSVGLATPEEVIVSADKVFD